MVRAPVAWSSFTRKRRGSLPVTTNRCVLASHPVQCGLNVSLIFKRDTFRGICCLPCGLHRPPQRVADSSALILQHSAKRELIERVRHADDAGRGADKWWCLPAVHAPSITGSCADRYLPPANAWQSDVGACAGRVSSGCRLDWPRLCIASPAGTGDI